MNVDKGAKTLEKLAYQGLISVPYRFKTFRYSSLPNFEGIAKSAKNGISVCLGLPQVWVNGSLYGILIRFLGTERDRIEDSVVSKHDLNINKVVSALKDSVRRVTRAFYKNVLSDVSPPDDFRGVTYQSWVASQVDYSYFVQVTGPIKNPNYLIQIDVENPNGWNFEPRLSIQGNEGDFQKNTCSIRGSISIDRTLLRPIQEQARKIYSAVSPQINNIVIEGKIMNNTYPTKGVIAIDLYSGYKNSNCKNLNHSDHIRLFTELSNR